jgi:hypothetical protein
MTNNSLTKDELYISAFELKTGIHGSFAQAIGDALIVADSGNAQKLLDAFPDIFMRGFISYQRRFISVNELESV